MQMKSLSKTISLTIVIIIVIELLFFSIWYTSQPNYETTIKDIVQTYQSPDGQFFYDSIQNKQPSLASIFASLKLAH